MQRATWANSHIGKVAQVTEALLARNLSEQDVTKVLGVNFLRVTRVEFG